MLTKINLDYRSLVVLAENGFQQIIFDSSIVAGSSSCPFSFFEVNMCESSMKDSIPLTKLENIPKYLKHGHRGRGGGGGQRSTSGNFAC